MTAFQTPPGSARPERHALRARGLAVVRAALAAPEAAAAAARAARIPPDAAGRDDAAAARLEALALAPALRRAVEAGFGARALGADAELVLDELAPHPPGWRQEYRCAVRGGLLAPFPACALVALGPGGRSLEVELAPGSHRAGRVEHVLRGGRSAARGARLGALLERHAAERVTLAPGDALVLHPCTLHRVLPARPGAAAAWLVAWYVLAAEARGAAAG